MVVRQDSNGILEFAVDYGPLILAMAVCVVAVMVADRRGPTWWKRYRAEIQNGWPSQIAFAAPLWAAVGVLAFVLSALAARLSPNTPRAFEPPWGWLLWGTLMAAVYLAIGSISKPYKEPEDWLLWGEEEAKRELPPPPRRTLGRYTVPVAILASIAFLIPSVAVYSLPADNKSRLSDALSDVAVAWTNAQISAHYRLRIASPGFLASQSREIARGDLPICRTSTWRLRWPPLIISRYPIAVEQIATVEGVSHYVLRCGPYELTATTAWPEGNSDIANAEVYRSL